MSNASLATPNRLFTGSSKSLFRYYVLGVGIATLLFVLLVSHADRRMLAEQERIFTEAQSLQTYLVRQSLEEHLDGLISQSGGLAKYSFTEFANGLTSRDSVLSLMRIEQEMNFEYLAHVYLDAPGHEVFGSFAQGAAANLEETIRTWSVDAWPRLSEGFTQVRFTVSADVAAADRRAMGLLFPVFAGNSLHGVLAVAVNLAPVIERIIEPMHSGASGAGLLLDGEGTVLYAPESRRIGDNVLEGQGADRSDRLRVDRRILSESSGTDSCRDGDRRMLVAWHAARAAGRKLVVVLEAPDSEIHAAVSSWRTMRLFLSLALALILLACTIVLFLTRQRILENGTRILSDEVARRTAELRQEVERRREREEALAASEARQRVILESLPDIVFLVDGEGRLLFVNAAAAATVGRKAEELTGRLDGELFGAEESGRSLPRIRQVLETGIPYHEEHAMTIPGRGEAWMDADLLPMKDASGKVLAVLGIAREITARKKAEKEKSLLETRMRWAQKLESLGSLAGGIAHDFNNMLMTIRANAEMARQDVPAGSPTHAALLEIETVAQRASQLSAQMLAYAGKGRRTREPLALSETVRAMDAVLRASVPKKTELHYDLAEGLPAVLADPQQIRQVLINLVVNASEAMEDGAGTVRIATGEAVYDRRTLAAGRGAAEPQEGRYAFLEVRDTGSGMDAAVQERIFDPFFSTKFTGRGLGLPAVLGIVHGHKGTILIDSAPGKGTTIRVLLPAAPAAADAAKDAPPGEAWKGGGTVLLVDDEEPVRRLCRRMLERLGFEVLEAPNGREALSIYGRKGAGIRCVVLDMAMPVMDGEETLAELHRLDGNVRVILSSGYDSRELASRGASGGVAAFLQKPYGMAGLKDALYAALERARESVPAKPA